MFGVHQPLTFYGHMNMKTSIDFPIVQSEGQVEQDTAMAILLEKNKRIQRLLPTLTCDKLGNYLDASKLTPTVVYYGPASEISADKDSRLGFLRQV